MTTVLNSRDEELQEIRELGDVDRVTVSGDAANVYPRFPRSNNAYLTMRIRELDRWRLWGVNMDRGCFKLKLVD